MFAFQYLFDGSSEVRTIEASMSSMTGQSFCNMITKNIFGDNPPCQLKCKEETVLADKLVTIQRVYGVKFEEEKVPVKPVIVMKPARKRVKRWKSRSPRRRRWRSRSPVNRYKRVYTNRRY